MDKDHQNPSVYTVSRASFLDVTDPSAGIHRTELRGFYIMYVLITASYIVISSLNRFFTYGGFVEDNFFWRMVADGKFVSLIWPGVFLYTWLAYGLQLLILKGLPQSLATIIQHSSQSLMFILATYIVFIRDWGFTQTLFIVLLTFTHLMKMHSYTLVNRDLRREHLKNPNKSKYPHNLTMRNYLEFLVTPALIYQAEYPRRQYFRRNYFILKTILLFVEIVCMYMLITENILPSIMLAGKISFLDLYIKLIVPCLLAYNLGFLVLFEQILNLFGELSLFGDREFYQDWWNSDGFADFSRKWNRPVHLFLHKHVYQEAINEYKWKPQSARHLTFLLSALCHEFLAALISRKITLYLFGLMMFQLPLALMTKFMQNTYFGLYLLWIGLIAGPPLLLTLYARSVA